MLYTADATGRKDDSPSVPDTIIVPYLGHVPRPDGSWLPTKPGPQGHNAGITPGFRCDRRSKPRPHIASHDALAERVDGLESLLCSAPAQLARLEAERGMGA